MTEALTVRELARKAQLPGEALDVTTARLRYWTRGALIRTAGARHPGIGREVLYPPEAALDVMVLSWLHVLGMPATVISEALDDLRTQIAECSPEDDAVVISRSLATREWSVGTVSLRRLTEWVLIPRRRRMSHIIIPLAELRAQMQPHDDDAAGRE
jgi:DNA-binding transcriptional MerR regulator